MNMKFQKAKRTDKYERDLDMLISLVTQKGLDPFREEKESNILYALEAEDIKSAVNSGEGAGDN